ncbi:hypothetical protein [Polaromonas sp. CG9_12]|nr:hypothetical protein [Polaromonas sp. CG9_12]
MANDSAASSMAHLRLYACPLFGQVRAHHVGQITNFSGLKMSFAQGGLHNMLLIL